jgi:hypothetical protein
VIAVNGEPVLERTPRGALALAITNSSSARISGRRL